MFRCEPERSVECRPPRRRPILARYRVDEVHAEGGKVLHFYSYCGGLPAPEDNDNPFGYKFSWSPRGVLLASKNPSKSYDDS